MDWLALVTTPLDLVLDVIALVGAAIAITAALRAGRLSRLQLFFVLSGVRTAARRLARRRDAPSRRLVSSIAAWLRADLIGVLSASERTPSDFMSRFLSNWTDDEVRTQALSLLADLLHAARAPGGQPALAHALWESSATAVKDRLDQLAEEVDSIDALVPSAQPLGRLGELTSAYTGSLILADGTANRSGVIDAIQVLHEERWSGPDAPHPPAGHVPAPDARGYDGWHGPGVDATRVRGAEATSRRPKPGDYDGRIFDLRGVGHYLDPRTDDATLRIFTHESCYNVSEQAPEHRGKHLTSMLADSFPGAPRFRRTDSGFMRAGGERVLLLNTCLTVVSVHDPSAPQVVLSERTARANNAADVVSATVGGVFEHSRGRRVGDVDERGRPDPTVSIVREAVEELGLEIAPEQAAPIAVMLANVQGRPTRDGNAWRRDNGQLVATVLYVAETSQSLDDIRHARARHANWTKGRFELARQRVVPLPTAAAPTREAAEQAVSAFFDQLESELEHLDQNAIVSLIYIAAYHNGVDVVADRLARMRSPWWGLGWAGDPDGRPRIVCDPASLVVDYAPIAEAQRAWDEIRRDAVASA